MKKLIIKYIVGFLALVLFFQTVLFLFSLGTIGIILAIPLLFIAWVVGKSMQGPYR